MNELLAQVIEDLRRFEVKLVMRRDMKARFPPEMMSGLAFTFNDHKSLGQHAKRMNEAVQIAKEVLLGEGVRGRELLAFQLEVKVLMLEVESRLELEMHDGVVAGTSKLCQMAEGHWEELCREVRLFVTQQATMGRQLLMLTEAILELPESFAVNEREAGWEDFSWGGEETALLELFLALEETGVLRWRRFEWKRTERLKRFSAAFGVEMKHSYQNINYLMNRKSGPARFMTQCSQALEHFREVREVEQNPPR